MPGNGLSGLSNLGNTCYINSCMQILSHSESLNTILKSVTKVNKVPDSYLLVEWNSLRDLMWSRNVTISPARFIKTIQHVSEKKENSLFTGFDQNDSAEFLIFCIDCFHNALKHKHSIKYDKTLNRYMNKGLELTKKTYKNDYSPVHKLFHSIVVTEICSLKQKILSIKCEYCLIYNLAFFKKTPHTLHECLDHYFKPELLEGDNEWFYDKLKKKIPVYKKTHLLYCPEIIIMDLKRWIDPSRKINIVVKADFILDLEKYSIIKDTDTIYELYGVCNHRGNPYGGHYWSHILNSNQKWYAFNDTTITEIPNNKVVTQNAYCFFYRKKK